MSICFKTSFFSGRICKRYCMLYTVLTNYIFFSIKLVYFNIFLCSFHFASRVLFYTFFFPWSALCCYINAVPFCFASEWIKWACSISWKKIRHRGPEHLNLMRPFFFVCCWIIIFPPPFVVLKGSLHMNCLFFFGHYYYFFFSSLVNSERDFYNTVVIYSIYSSPCERLYIIYL